MTESPFHGWRVAPRVAVLFPPEGSPGWADAAFWAALLEAWGVPADRLPLERAGTAAWHSTVVAPAAALDADGAATLSDIHVRGTSLLLAGAPSGGGTTVDRVRFDDPDLLARAGACVPAPDANRAVRVGRHAPRFDAEGSRSWEVLARWLPADGSGDGPPAIALQRNGNRAASVWFGLSAGVVDWRGTEAVVAAAELALELAAPAGLVGLWRWPDAKPAALVVDGDVDHPTGVDPECSRYVAPALETARRAGFNAYGIFAAAANVDAEPRSFPPAPGYYNHSYGHPYSYWDPRPWEELDAGEMEKELTRSNETFLRHLGLDDEGIFRLPHFQLTASDRTYAVLDRLGYRADSSIGANVSVTGGLPFHPALRAWSEREADAAFARTHPDPAKRHRLLQLPISTDPTDPAFPHGCCSYNTLGETVRLRTADPAAYEAVLGDVVERAVARRSLAHVFIDPPDAGYGRLELDEVDYSSAVERWMRRCTGRNDLAILTTAGLATWWLEREEALGRLWWAVDEGLLKVDLDRAPPGTTLVLLGPGAPGGRRAWRLVEWAGTPA